MKKAISVFAIAVFMISAMSVTAFAHGGHGHGYRSQAQQPCHELCTATDCDIVGPHQHDGVWYCSQAEGCVNYETCTVEGCAQRGLHEHDGTYYRCAYHGTGRGCGKGWNR